MWKLALMPCNSFSGNICFECLVLCLCSVVWQNKMICFGAKSEAKKKISDTFQRCLWLSYFQILLFIRRWLSFTLRYCRCPCRSGSKTGRIIQEYYWIVITLFLCCWLHPPTPPPPPVAATRKTKREERDVAIVAVLADGERGGGVSFSWTAKQA